MRDEIDGRLWAEHGRSFSDSLASLFSQVRIALKRLNEIEFEAPWRQAEKAK